MDTYEFVVVGGGPSGCALARRLADSALRPSVLLLEAGGENADRSLRIDGERYITRTQPGLNWGYTSTPQEQLNGRVLSLDRGKGLGGSSAINFGYYLFGPRDDFEEIARILGDDEWSWGKIKPRLKELETYHHYDGIAHTKYLRPSPEDHGTSGRLHIGFPRALERITADVLDIAEASGIPLNPDLNSGNPLGIGLGPNTAYHGVRSTSADLLIGAPSNLEVRSGAFVERVLFKQSTAIGVQANELTYFASKEVILSAGSIDSPKLLMLSGIGPAQELQQYDIPVLKDLPGLGKGLKDHPVALLSWRRADHTSDRPAYYRDAKAVLAARKQWEIDGTGPLSEYGTSIVMGFLKNDEICQSAEFQALPEEVRQHLLKPTVPHFETAINGPMIPDIMSPATSVARQGMFVFVMNPQSEGDLKLRSADPHDALIYNPNFLAHPYDCRVAIESVRSMIDFADGAHFAKDTIAAEIVPKSKSDEDVLDFWRNTLMPGQHPTGTAKMGTSEQPDACLDTDFRVLGVKKLRVVDMSAVPILTNNATQSTAYLTGLVAGDKIAREYGLDGDKQIPSSA